MTMTIQDWYTLRLRIRAQVDERYTALTDDERNALLGQSWALIDEHHLLVRTTLTGHFGAAKWKSTSLYGDVTIWYLTWAEGNTPQEAIVKCVLGLDVPDVSEPLARGDNIRSA